MLLEKSINFSGEIEALEKAIRTGDSNPARVGQLFEGQLKGEASIVDVEKGLLGAEAGDFAKLQEIADDLNEEKRIRRWHASSGTSRNLRLRREHDSD